ncbi:hypothetical protein DFH11DRAFT_1547543 [Phellopilus nigrolimitatus]|nr:hypothetical protein DFH11DRAFT_1547543 [Phellopilus nigrolimitatus]
MVIRKRMRKDVARQYNLRILRCEALCRASELHTCQSFKKFQLDLRQIHGSQESQWVEAHISTERSSWIERFRKRSCTDNIKRPVTMNKGTYRASSQEPAEVITPPELYCLIKIQHNLQLILCCRFKLQVPGATSRKMYVDNVVIWHAMLLIRTLAANLVYGFARQTAVLASLQHDGFKPARFLLSVAFMYSSGWRVMGKASTTQEDMLATNSRLLKKNNKGDSLFLKNINIADSVLGITSSQEFGMVRRRRIGFDRRPWFLSRIYRRAIGASLREHKELGTRKAIHYKLWDLTMARPHIAGMDDNNEQSYNSLKEVAFTAPQVLLKLRGTTWVSSCSVPQTGDMQMSCWREEAQHEKIIRDLAVRLAFLYYGRREQFKDVVKMLLAEKDSAIAVSILFLAHMQAFQKKAPFENFSVSLFPKPLMGLSYSGHPPRLRVLEEAWPGTKGYASPRTGLQDTADILEPMIEAPSTLTRWPVFGAALGQGLIDTGGHNVTISLHSRAGSRNTSAVMDMGLFVITGPPVDFQFESV